MDDETLRAVIHDQRVEIYVLYVEGVPAGFTEIDRRAEPDIEIAYFGLVPEYIGRGLGDYFLSAALDIAWSHEPKRVWVSTNTLDPLVMDDKTLRAVIHDQRVEIYVLYVEGVPAGFAELDRRAEPDIELAYFGLVPEFIGRGLSGYLLSAALDIAWSHEPKRVWLNTNTLDHPRALALYQRLGFKPYKQERKTIPDPRVSGLIPSAG